MFKSILIANRGEIAVRIMRTARRMGLKTVAVYSDADRGALHVREADAAVWIGPAPAADSYLRIGAIIEAARQTGAEAIHPGYGFVSENPAFVEACDGAGIVFIGPPATAIRAMGLKDAAKRLMEQAGVPVVPGYYGEEQDVARLTAAAAQIGYPVLIKARAGGGGKGMRRVEREEDFAEAFSSAQREAISSFGDGGVIVEKYVTRPRHIEVQIFSDAYGNAVHLFERDCSLQRRHQKVIEEAPAPGMSGEMRAAMGQAAVKAALAVGYRGAGTVEFIADTSEGLRGDRFYFMEMNTRLQVEHPVTEAITGIDLVEWQLRVAAGEPFTRRQEQIRRRGHAFEARIYAEDAARQFAPATGRLVHLALPFGMARVDTGVRQGDEITPYYDPMIAKVIVHGRDRASALAKLSRAIEGTRIAGSVTNVGFLGALLRHPLVVAGEVDTGLIEREFAALTAVHPPDAATVGLAALTACGLCEVSGKTGADPWRALTAWRQWGPAVQTVRLNSCGQTLDVVVSSFDAHRHQILVGDACVSLELISREGVHVRFACDGIEGNADIVAVPGEVGVYRKGGTYLFALPDEGHGEAEADAGDDGVRAPIPGVVKLVAAIAGARVKKGDALIVLEAMKMEHTLRASRDGVIAEVLARAGEVVQEGDVLVRLSEAVAVSTSP